jgi:hypothetical protein
MTAFLGATCGAIVFLAAVLITIELRTRWRHPFARRPMQRLDALGWPPDLMDGYRPDVSVARQQAGSLEVRRGGGPADRGGRFDERGSAKILPFVRKPIGVPARAERPHLAATWHGRRDQNDRGVGHLRWSPAHQSTGRAGARHPTAYRHGPNRLFKELTR